MPGNAGICSRRWTHRKEAYYYYYYLKILLLLFCSSNRFLLFQNSLYVRAGARAHARMCEAPAEMLICAALRQNIPKRKRTANIHRNDGTD